MELCGLFSAHFVNYFLYACNAYAFGALTLLVGSQEEHPACTN